MDKREKLKKLEEEIIKAKLPLMETANLVFGEGNPDSPVLFIGEAPGQREDELRRPFVGRSGQLLDKMIGEIGWKREDVYITNIVKRRPPENRDPSPEEIESYKPYLARQIEILNPKVIAPLGRFSMNYFLPFAKISRDQGKVFEKDGRLIFPLFHPAAALRATGVLNELREAFKKLPDVVSGKIFEPETPAEPAKEEKKKAEQKKLF
jgi:uracil-DNA glycosylase family 4